MNTKYVQIVILKLKIKNTTLLEQFKNLIEKIVHTESKSMPLAHLYMATHFPGLVQALE